MPTQLVTDVRRRLVEEGRPLSHLERALLLATLAPRRTGGEDVVDELEAAIITARRYALGAEVPEDARRATRRLLAAARGVLDYAPPVEDVLETAPQLDHGGRPERADVDG